MEKRIGFEQRILALLIDGGIMLVVNVVIWIVLKANWLGQVLSAIAVLAYMFTEVMNAASPGKKILGLKIASADGTPAGQDVLLKRYLVKMAPNLFMLLAAIFNIFLLHGLLQSIGGLLGLGLAFGSLYLVLQPGKQAVWDQLANTCVIRESAAMESYSTPESRAEAVVVPPPPPPAPEAEP